MEHRQLAGSHQLLVGGEFVRGADSGLADAGDTEGEEALPGRAESVFQLGPGGAGNLLLHKTHGRLAKETGRLARLITVDLPALGVGCGPRDAGSGQRRRVGDTEVPTRASQERWTPSGHAVQLLPGRVAADIEAAVIVSTPEDPAVADGGGCGHGRGPKRLLERGEGGDGPRPGVDEAETETVGDRVGVVVVEPGEKRPPLEIDHAGRGSSDILPDLVAAADACNAIADDRHRFGGRLVIVDGDHRAVQENEIGGHRRVILCLRVQISGPWLSSVAEYRGVLSGASTKSAAVSM